MDVLRLGLTSGETSPSRTMFSICTLSANSRNRLRLMRPMGHRSALRRDVEVYDRPSIAIASVCPNGRASVGEVGLES